MKTSHVVAYLESTGGLDLDLRSPWPGRAGPAEITLPLRADLLLARATAALQRPGSDAASSTVLEALNDTDPTATSMGGSAVRWDVDAWYQPVHTHAYDSGLFVREQAVVALARELASFARASSLDLPPTNDTANQLLRMAFLVLYLHQNFHHRVEMLGLQMEVVEQTPRYVAYLRGAYARAAGTDDQLEEALANAYVYRTLTRRAHCADVPAPVRRVVTDFVKQSWSFDAPGLRAAGSFVAPEAWDKGLGELHARVNEATTSPSRRATWRHLGPDLTGSFLDPATDVFVVASAGAPAVLPRPSEPVTTCTPAQMVGILERAGYTPVRRNRGPHARLTAKGRAIAIVPGTGPLSPGAAERLLGLVDSTLADLPSLLSPP